MTLTIGEGLDLPVTISGGVAMLEDGDTADVLVDRADRALYAAKERGRNQLLHVAAGAAASRRRVGLTARTPAAHGVEVGRQSGRTHRVPLLPGNGRAVGRADTHLDVHGLSELFVAAAELQ